LYVDRYAEDEADSRAESQSRWLNRLRAIYEKSSKELLSRQARYKRAFDASVRPRRKPSVGNLVFVRKEQPTRREKWHKLTAKALGPYKVTSISDDGKLVTISTESGEEVVDLETIELAPNPQQEMETEATASSSADNRETRQDRGADYVVDKLVDHRPISDEEPSKLEFLVKWFGHQEKTWEPVNHLRSSQILRYCRNRKIPLPENYNEARKS